MDEARSEQNRFGAQRISRVLLRIAPPVTLAQLIQALYNIVDRFFVGRYSAGAFPGWVWAMPGWPSPLPGRLRRSPAWPFTGASCAAGAAGRRPLLLFRLHNGLCP